MFVSSANKKNVSFFETFARSFMYGKNKRGPRTEPCGTPQLISKVSEVLPQTETYCFLSVRYDLNHCSGIPLIP